MSERVRNKMIGELIEKLCIANIKLFETCNQKANMAKSPNDFTKKQMAQVMKKDIELCKQRAMLKTAIDNELNRSIVSGGTTVIDEVKNYGS